MSKTPSPSSDGSSPSPRVLVVEDWGPIAREVKHQLEQASYVVVGPAPRLNRALEIAEKSEFEAALLDIDLDGQRVYPLAYKLRERKVPFIFMTGFGLNDLPEDLADVQVFEKPVDYPALLLALAALVSRGQAAGDGRAAGPAAAP